MLEAQIFCVWFFYAYLCFYNFKSKGEYILYRIGKFVRRHPVVSSNLNFHAECIFYFFHIFNILKGSKKERKMLQFKKMYNTHNSRL